MYLHLLGLLLEENNMDMRLARKIESDLLSSIDTSIIQKRLKNHKIDLITVIGAPAGGKTITLDAFSELYNLQSFETGKLFREDIHEVLTREQTELYESLRTFYTDVNDGLIMDTLAIPFVSYYLYRQIREGDLNPKLPIYSNGVPRTSSQAKLLNGFMNLSKLIHFYIGFDESIRRQQLRKEKYDRVDLLSPEQKYYVYEKYASDVMSYFYEHNKTVIKVDNTFCRTKEEGLELVTKIFKENHLI